MTEPPTDGDVNRVFLLTVDSLRADHMSAYGYDRETTPNLDRFCERAVRFENAFSTSSHTRESVPSILTGRYPDEAIDERYHLTADSIAARLDPRVQSAAFHSNPYVSRAYDFGSDFDTFEDDLRLGGWKITAFLRLAWNRLRGHFYARAGEINDRSLRWIDEREADEPLFVWNHYMDPHDPYEPPEGSRAEFGVSVPDDMQSMHRRAGRDPESITDDERQRLVDLYDAEVAHTDRRLGEFIDALEQRGLLEESLVVVSSDHGDAFGEHGYYGHPRRLHDELTHVPLLVSGSGFGAGEVVTAPVGTINIPSTVLRAFGAETGALEPEPLQDICRSPDAARTVFSQAGGEGDNSHLYRFSARDGEDTVLLERHRETGEVLEIAENGAPDLAEELKAHSRSHLPAWTPSEDDVAEEEVEQRLKALGYKDD